MSFATILASSLALSVFSESGAAVPNIEVVQKPMDPRTRLDELGLSVQGEMFLHPSSFGFHFCGVRVTRVRPGSAAHKAGLKVGDLIHTVNGHGVDDFLDPVDKFFGEQRLSNQLTRRGRAILVVERSGKGDVDIAILLN